MGDSGLGVSPGDTEGHAAVESCGLGAAGASEMRKLMQRSRESKPASPGLPSPLHPPLGGGGAGGKPGNREADALARCCRWARIPARTAPLSRSCHHFKALIKVLRVDTLALKP